MLDLETLRFIWWLLLGVLFMGFAITDGFDLGIATLFPLVTRDEIERQIVLKTIGPFWEGNQVWIILGAGALFAAWPYVYAVAFSGAYFVILLLLLTMGISRPVSFKYRSKLPNHFWRRFWDWMVFIGGFVPSLIFGMLVGNVIQGIPFNFDNDLRVYNTGHFSDLFNPFAFYCGLVSLFLLTMHGSVYLALKTKNAICKRAIFCARISAFMLILLFAGAGLWVALGIKGYQVISVLDPQGYSNPVHKEVITSTGAWMMNYTLHPALIFVPVLGFLGALFVIVTAPFSRFAFIFSSLSIIGVISTFGVSLFPFLLPSSANPSVSLLVWDASSSALTLLLMLFAVLIFLPIIILYTSWVYKVLGGKVSRESIEKEGSY